MTIYGFYTDESGNNGFGDLVAQPVLCYAGVLVPLHRQVELDKQFYAIAQQVKNKIARQIHGIPEKALQEIKFFREFEIHGKDFLDGEDFYSKLSAEERFHIVEQLLSLIQEEDFAIISSVINKRAYKQTLHTNDHYDLYTYGYKQLVRTMNSFLQTKQSYAFMICDDGKLSELQCLMQATQKSFNQRVYPDIQIKKSHDASSHLIQLADLINFISSVYYRTAFHYPARKKHQQRIEQIFRKYIGPKQHVHVFE